MTAKLLCLHCSKPLTGRQTKSCSPKCRKIRKQQTRKQYCEDNKERIAKQEKLYRSQPHIKEQIAKYRKQRREDNKERDKQYRKDNKEHIKKRMKQYRKDKKERIYKHICDTWHEPYNTCHHCGAKGIDFMSIGHINQDGKQHRKTFGVVSRNPNITQDEILYWNIHIECFNCNFFLKRTNRYPTKQKLKTFAQAILEKLDSKNTTT